MTTNLTYTGASPVPLVTLFSYREGATIAHIMDQFKEWAVAMGPEVQTILDVALTNFELQFNELAEKTENDIAAAKDGWGVLFDQFMVDVTAQIAVLSDQAMANLINDSTSKLRAALDKRIQDSEYSTSAFLRGSKLTVYGHSYTTVPGFYVEPYTEEWSSQLSLKTGIPRTSHGVSGDRMIKVTGHIVGDKRWSPGNLGVIAVEGMMNDILLGPATVAGRKGYANALRTFLAVASAGRRHESSSAVTKGAWETLEDTTLSSGSVLHTVEKGASITFANVIAPTGKVYMLVVGNPVGYVGGNLGFTVDGIDTGVTYKNADQMDPFTGAPHQSVVVEIPVSPYGVHTVEAVVLNDSAGRVYVDGLLTQAAAPPQVLVLKDPPVGNRASQVNQDAWDANSALIMSITEEVCAEFSNVRTVDLAPGWNPATMVADSDTAKFHPNAVGMAHIAEKVRIPLINAVARNIDSAARVQAPEVAIPERVEIVFKPDYASVDNPNPVVTLMLDKVKTSGIVKRVDDAKFAAGTHLLANLPLRFRPKVNQYLVARSDVPGVTFNVDVKTNGDIVAAPSQTGVAAWVSLNFPEWLRW